MISFTYHGWKQETAAGTVTGVLGTGLVTTIRLCLRQLKETMSIRFNWILMWTRRLFLPTNKRKSGKFSLFQKRKGKSFLCFGYVNFTLLDLTWLSCGFLRHLSLAQVSQESFLDMVGDKTIARQQYADFSLSIECLS